MLTSLTNQLTGDLRSRRADTTFFHQFHQCSLPDDHRQTDRQTDEPQRVKHLRNLWLNTVILPRWSPEMVNLLGL